MKKFFTLMFATGTVMSCSAKIQYPTKTVLTDSGDEVRFSMICHGSINIEYKGLSIQVDPVWKNGDKEVDYTIFPEADIILVTHEHSDHLCKQTIDMLSGPKTKVFINKAGYEKLGKGQILRNGDALELEKGIKIKAVAAYNTTEGRERFHAKGNGNGYLLEIDGLKVYISGDSEYIEEMSALKDIDIAFLAANQPYTMTVEQCLDAAMTIHPRILIPYHLSDTDASAIKEGLSLTDIEVLLYEDLR